MYSIDKNALMKAYDGKLAVVDADSRPVPGPTASFSPYFIVQVSRTETRAGSREGGAITIRQVGLREGLGRARLLRDEIKGVGQHTFLAEETGEGMRSGCV